MSGNGDLLRARSSVMRLVDAATMAAGMIAVALLLDAHEVFGICASIACFGLRVIAVSRDSERRMRIAEAVYTPTRRK
jgi:hypothetical protein